MSDLTFIEKNQLEKLLGMGGGCVLDFSNRTLQEFVADSVGLDIYSDKYEYASGSKANRLRAFWTKEPNHLVGKLLSDLISYASQSDLDPQTELQLNDCKKIGQRLSSSGPVADASVFDSGTDDQTFALVAKEVRKAINENRLEAGLDRLHTFAVHYFRKVASKYGIQVPKDKPLHSIVGEYSRKKREQGEIESQMAERILKSTVKVLESFNHVRNNQTLAHANDVLNYDESLLIFNHVTSTLSYIEALEGRSNSASEPQTKTTDFDDIPF